MRHEDFLACCIRVPLSIARAGGVTDHQCVVERCGKRWTEWSQVKVCWSSPIVAGLQSYAVTSTPGALRWQALPEGAAACIIGRMEAGDGRVILETNLGGRRILDELEDDPLPRI
jgi:hypothetical protein